MPSASTPRRQALGAALLCLVVVLWGFNWPVMKQVVALMPPIWAAVVRTGGAAVCLFALQLASGRLTWPARGDLPVLASSALVQMALSNTMVNLALQLVPAGRSAVMVYTIPLWAIPIAALWLGEAITVARMVGLAFGLGGLLLLFNPASFDWSNGSAILGNGLLLVAAIGTAAPIVHMRKHRWRGSPFDLAPWQCTLAALALLPLAWGLEGVPAGRLVAAAGTPSRLRDRALHRLRLLGDDLVQSRAAGDDDVAGPARRAAGRRHDRQPPARREAEPDPARRAGDDRRRRRGRHAGRADETAGGAGRGHGAAVMTRRGR